METRDPPAAPSLLVDLRNCYEGFAGIPQELRLLFAHFTDMPFGRLGGLASGIHHRAPRERAPRSAYENVMQQTRMIIAQDSKRHPLPLPLRLLPGRLRERVLYPFSALVTAHRPERLDREIDREIFEDYLWTRLFDKTLPPDRRGIIGKARFFATELGHENARHLAMLPRPFAKRLDSTGWDLFFAASVSPYRIPASTRMVVRYYDALPLTSPHTIGDAWPHATSHGRMLARNMEAGATFVCDSEPVRADVLKLFPEAEARVLTIPALLAADYRPEATPWSGVQEILSRRASPKSPGAGAAPAEGTRLVMAVSTLEPRKNYMKLFEAFEIAQQASRVPMRLVIVANPGWRSEAELAALRGLVKRGAAHHLAAVPLPELRRLYSAAHCVVSPSRAEGFDYSGVESMACGTPVIASDIPVHRWVYGEAAEYFDPYSAEAMAELIGQFVELPRQEGFLAALRARGLRQAALYGAATLMPRWEELLMRLGRLDPPAAGLAR
ncbi:glycosyltransferase family 4 protein [Falsiroseomonas selenitidurans]|uniref:Glycosyltransferase family 4 protein n=1 Tax=Falsiroseomonas selenitidurans TaxID=2716335 RepID=A0ABX1DZA9_9PROT|nr:glycosyltransferase family 1 protein [Falsiroseomonas selenitidurans]NKC30245.1 glycosyltransferase family 4 protein [Falsiroseomonas selenitidurans]